MNDQGQIQNVDTNVAVNAAAPGKLYFIGIGGIGMSAIARYFNTQGARISGYDKTRTALCIQLEQEGISIHYEENVELCPKDVDLVIYTPAIPPQHTELQYYRLNNYRVIKRSDALKIITESSFNICVAGTHGKTTVSSMIAHLLRHSGYGCNAFLGGITANYNTNFWSDKRNVCVIEADEYDRSFLKLSPDIEVITAMDPDHLDIYGTPEEFEKAFVLFARQLKKGGLLFYKLGLSRAGELDASPHRTYSYNNKQAEVYASNIVVFKGSYRFDVVYGGQSIKELVLNMGGLHNIENMVAAVAVAKQLDIEEAKIKDAVAAFKGVKRRFEYILKSEKHVLIDDYAHHPEELRALIDGVRSLFSEKLVIVFQPHLFSRTKDQADGFAAVLDKADEVILLPIYPARELPVPGVTSSLIVDKMKLAKRQVLEKEDMLQWVQHNQPALLVMAGAGDIDVMLQPVKQILESA